MYNYSAHTSRWKGRIVVECPALEKRYRGNLIASSNLAPSETVSESNELNSCRERPCAVTPRLGFASRNQTWAGTTWRCYVI